MKRADWIKYSAFAGLAFLALALLASRAYSAWWHYHQENTQKRESAAQKDTSHHQEDRPLNCVLMSEREFRCLVASPDSEAADEHTKADLKAQQDAAEWSFLSMMLNGVGVVLSALAVAFTGWAAWAAASASKSAQAAVDLAREISANETRAYINAVTAELRWTDHKASEPYIVLGVQNCGHTPAKWLDIRSKTFTTLPFASGQLRKFIFSDIDLEKNPTLRRATAMPGNGDRRHFGCTDAADQTELRNAFNEDTVIHIAGVIRYETMFDETVETEFWFYGENVTKFMTVEPPPSTTGMARRLVLPERPYNLSMAIGDFRTYEIIEKQK